MTENQMKEMLKTLSSIECKFMAAVFTFVKKVEDATGMPYSAAMIRTWEWLREKGAQTVVIKEDGSVTQDKKADRYNGTEMLYIRWLDSDICVCDWEPSNRLNRYGGSEKTDYHVVFTFQKNLNCLLSDYVYNIGDRPADIAEYKNVAANQARVVNGISKFGDAMLYVVGLSMSQDDASNDVSVLNDILSGSVGKRELDDMAKKKPKGSPTLAQEFARQFNADRDDDDD